MRFSTRSHDQSGCSEASRLETSPTKPLQAFLVMLRCLAATSFAFGLHYIDLNSYEGIEWEESLGNKCDTGLYAANLW